MHKFKYKYNPETLQYKLVKKSLRDKTKNLLIFASIVAICVIAINIFLSHFYMQPSELYYNIKNSELNEKCDSISQQLSEIENQLAEIEKKDDYLYRPLLEVAPLSSSIRTAGYGGSEPYENFSSYNKNDFFVDVNNKLNRISSKLYVQLRSYEKLYQLALDKNELKSCIPAIQPISNENNFYISSSYGYRTDPFTKRLRAHHGIDFAAKIGIPIYATGDAKVIKVRHSKIGYGNQVLLDHGHGYKTRYGHLHEIYVKKGDIIKRGFQIGTMGNTGRSTGPHLHYEVLLNNYPVNPLYYYNENISNKEYQEILSQSKEN